MKCQERGIKKGQGHTQAPAGGTAIRDSLDPAWVLPGSGTVAGQEGRWASRDHQEHSEGIGPSGRPNGLPVPDMPSSMSKF